MPAPQTGGEPAASPEGYGASSQASLCGGAPAALAETGKKPLLGLLAILSCNVIWGFLPLYWRAIRAVPAGQIVCQRIVWSCLTLLVICLCGRKLGTIRNILRTPRQIGVLALCSAMISVNWLIYVSMVNTGQVVLASLSTYIGPLFTVALGMIFLGNRLSLPQWLAMFLAAVGVGIQISISGSVPWAALLMALFTAGYGLLRALLNVEVIPGLFIENLLAVPVVMVFLLCWQAEGSLVFAQGDLLQDALVAGTGIITAFPLILLVFAMRNAQMTTVGPMQFVSPSLIFIMGVFVFKEHFTLTHFFSFAFIWTGLALYSTDSVRRFNRRQSLRKLKPGRERDLLRERQ